MLYILWNTLFLDRILFYFLEEKKIKQIFILFEKFMTVENVSIEIFLNQMFVVH